MSAAVGDGPSLALQVPAATLQGQPGEQADTLRVPVEVVAKGSKTEWVFVEVQNQAIPEPSALAMLLFSLALCLRRRRQGHEYS